MGDSLSNRKTGKIFVKETLSAQAENGIRRLATTSLSFRPKKMFRRVKDDSSPAIRPNGPFPIFVGEMFDGIDIVCDGCKKQVLASNVLEKQFHGIALVCPICKARNKAPPVAIDEPINPSRVIVLAEPETIVGHSVSLDIFTEWIGIVEAEAFAMRTGYPGRWRVARWNPLDYNVDSVNRLRKSRVRSKDDLDLSGVTTLAALIDRVSHYFPRSIQDSVSAILKGTMTIKEDDRHPLFVSLSKLSKKVREANADIRTNDPYLMILLHSFYAFQRWHNHPRYEKLCQNLDRPEMFAHNVSQLAIAAFLQDLGNGVSLAPESPGIRRCDLWISGGPANLVSLEVKSRNELRTLKLGLSPDNAAKAIKAAFDSAGINQGGQLDPSSPGILGLGGFALSSTDMETILKKARLLLQEMGDNAKHIAAVLAFSVGLSIDGPGETIVPTKGINLGTLHGVVVNPKYDGSVLIHPLVLSPVVSLLGISRSI